MVQLQLLSKNKFHTKSRSRNKGSSGNASFTAFFISCWLHIYIHITITTHRNPREPFSTLSKGTHHINLHTTAKIPKGCYSFSRTAYKYHAVERLTPCQSREKYEIPRANHHFTHKRLQSYSDFLLGVVHYLVTCSTATNTKQTTSTTKT